jgi:hypothetical protein
MACDMNMGHRSGQRRGARDKGILLDSFYCFSVAVWDRTPAPFADNFSVRREAKRDDWLRP